MKRPMALMVLMTLTACDFVEKADIRRERADGLYRAAMEDYRAGRLDAARAGFEKTIRRDPANASARFQLACLLQDAKHDNENAYFCYREYLLQQPESDKAQAARDRMALCEKDLAKKLATRHGLVGQGALAQEIESLQRELSAAQTRAAAAEKELGTLRGRVSALTAERERLLAVVKGVGEAGEAVTADAKNPLVREAKDLLEEDEDSGDRIKISSDVAALKSEEKEELTTGSSILPTHTAEDGIRPAEKPAERAQPAPAAHPETYVVKEGDTLYGIAKRYYGRLSAWKEIRDANKALISADNRLRAGDTIKLP